MPARTNCCGYFNLAKLDPTTGAIIWQTVVDAGGAYGLSTKFEQTIWFIEPLRGTNDILVGVSFQGAAASIVRVDPTGAQVWWYPLTGFSSWPNPGRMFGSDGSTIVAGTGSGFVGLDYNGNVVWTASHPTTPSVIAVSPGRFTSSTNVSPYQRTFDITTGALTSSGTWFYSARNADAVDQSTGNFFIRGDALNSYLLDPVTFAPVGVSSVPHNGTRSRWGASGISQVYSGAVMLLSTSLSLLWSITTVGGYPVGAPVDTDNDATGTYFATQSTTAAQVQVFKVDNTGAAIWGNLKFGVGNSYSGANAVAVADDGYIYAGGYYGTR